MRDSNYFNNNIILINYDISHIFKENNYKLMMRI